MVDSDREALWEVTDGFAKVFLYGEGPPPATPWRSARIEAALIESKVFWKETPEPGPEAKALAIAEGIDRDAPLSSWLTQKEQLQLAAAAEAVGTTAASLESFRPWLAGQALNANMARHFGLNPSNGSNPVLTATAVREGKAIHTEFPSAAAAVRFFSNLPKPAEIQYLMHTIDWIEEGPTMMTRRATAWTDGDLSVEAGEVSRMALAHPELYEAYVVSRNREWPARIRAMLNGSDTTFVLVGGDHLVGPDSVLAQLEAACLVARRV
jgi:hypothetical protein